MKDYAAMDEAYFESRGRDPFAGVRVKPILSRDNPERARFRGVTWNRAARVFMARGKIGNEVFYIGGFHTGREAAHAYDSFRWWLQDFCKRRPDMNFPEEVPPMLPRVRAIRRQLLQLGYPNDFKHETDFEAPETSNVNSYQI